MPMLDQWFMSFGPIAGNILKNVVIALSIGFVLFAVAIILMAQLFLIYKRALDKVNQQYLKDILKGRKPAIAYKKPMDIYKPDDVAVMLYAKDDEKNFLLDPKSIPEVIDICLAILILKVSPYRIFHHLNLHRAKAIFYTLILLMIALSYIGLRLILDVIKDYY